MNILFVVTKYYPQTGGTPNCVRNIIKKLKINDAVDIITTKNDILDVSNDSVDDCEVYRITYFDRISAYNLASNVKENVRFLKYLFLKIFFKVFPLEKYFLVRKYRRKIRQLCNKKKYDWIIAVAGDIYPAVAVLKENSPSIKRCFYQLDPYSTNETLHGQNKKREQIEKKIHQNFDLVLTTDIIINELKQKFTLCKRSIACGFPTIIDRTDNKKRGINTVCMFCGALYSARNINFCLEVIKKICSKTNNIFFTFYASGNTDLLQDVCMTTSQVRAFPPVSQDIIFNCMKESDILINIGNVVSNQVPSKIFDYISTGKPIINFAHTRDCLSAQVLKKYSLALNIYEDQSLGEAADEIIQFIRDTFNSRVDYTTIASMYYSNTIECVYTLIRHELKNNYHKE